MRTLDTNHKTLGILWVIYAVISLAQAAWVFLNIPVLTVMWGAIITRVANPYGWMDFFHLILIGVIVLAIVTAIVAFLAGFSLMSGAASGRTLAIVAAILALLRGPLGVAIGVYTLVVLLRGTAVEDYRMPAAA
jgi:hypothetical protein